MMTSKAQTKIYGWSIAPAVLVLTMCVAIWAVPARAMVQAQVAVPTRLEVLEQKMENIRFNTARFSVQLVLGELGSRTTGFEVGGEVTKNTLVDSIAGVFRFSPPASMLTNKVKGHAVREWSIGRTLYTYMPSVARVNGGRPWVRSRQTPTPKPQDRSLLSELPDALGPTFSTGGRGRSVSVFAKLIGDLGEALSIQEIGPATVDGQDVTEFIASMSLTSLLGGPLSPRELEEANGTGGSTAQMELFIAPDGVPVRTIGVFERDDKGLAVVEDILGIDIPVMVHAPPASKTIGEAQLRRIQRRRAKKVKRKG